MEEVYFEKNDNLRNNILIKNIIKYYKDYNIAIIHNGKYDYCKQDIGKKSKLFINLFITEEEFLNCTIDKDIYILMNTQMIDNLDIISKKLEDKKTICISRERNEKIQNEYSIEELKLRHSKRWREKTFLKNNEIIDWIKDTMDIAEERIYLECPWYNEKVFDEEFIEKIETAVKNGIDVRIKYGIKLEEDIRADKTRKLIGKLKSIGNYANLNLIESDSHAKVAFIDNLYLSTSLNFGSNSMKNKNSSEEKGNISIYRDIKDINEIQKAFSI